MKILSLFLILMFSVSPFAKVLDDPSIKEVFQREYIFTDSSVDEYVQTYGVNTCVAVVVYDGHSKVSLAHFDSATDIEKSLKDILRDYDNRESIKVSLYGGVAPYKLEKSIVSTLEEYDLSPSVIERNRNSNDSKNITVEVSTGDVFEYDEMYSSTPWNIASHKVDRLKFRKRIYRHEESLGGGDFLDIRPVESFNIFNFQ
jgi:hypothetical protein